jgi:intracellular multiplication protein IcmJ
MEFEIDLILSASRKSWKMSSTHGTEYDKEYKDQKGNPGKQKAIWDSIWSRDKNKCYYCRFESKKYQEIHHLNDDHSDNSTDNLVTVCPLCHQNFHLDTSSTTNGGKIVWLPEFSQQELNYLSRAIFIAIDEADAKEETENLPGFIKIARILENSLAERSLIVDQQIQNGASDPAIFANALINMTESQYEKRFGYLKPFKLLNLRSRFPIQTKYWKNNVFKDIPINTWEKLIIKKN